MANYSNDIMVIENCINLNQQNDLKEFVTNYRFPWSYYSGTILPTDVTYQNDCIVQTGINPPQFSHFMSVENSSNISLVAPILNCLANVFNSNIQILKLKFNLLTKSSDNTHHWPHADIDNYTDDVMTGLYYLIDSDGPTYLFEQFAPKESENISIVAKVEPEKGKLAIFDSRRFHASSSPTMNETRIVLNVVFRIPKDEQ
jgi:hypothetical protein